MSQEVPKLSEEIQAEVAKAHHLRPVETVEKQVLPTKEVLEQERHHEQFKKGIETFDGAALNKVVTEEKNSLPTGEDIVKEKAPKLAAEFDHGKLKHVEPEVKTHVPSSEEYAREKVKSEASSFDHGKLKHVEPQVKTDVVVSSQ